MRSSVRPLRGAWLAALAASGVLLLAASAASAHGLGSEDPNRPVGEYLWLGTKHLLAGWDHLLFILAIVLVAGSLWRATKLLSLFVLGHSITLALATFQEWTISTTLVDVVIALSVVAVAVIGLRWRRPDWAILGGGLFIFGLIHGMGLATRLQDLGVSDNSLAARVLLFNIGVEIGQAVAVLGFAALGWLLVRLWRRPEQLMRPAFALIALAGLIGAMVLSIQSLDDPVEDTSAGAATVQTTATVETTAQTPEPACRVIETPAAPSAPGGGHPAQRFYGPDETYPEVDFGHVLMDGYVIVTYRPDLAAEEITELRLAIERGQEGLLGGAAPGQDEALIATTLARELRCDSVEIDTLIDFRDEWIAEYTGGP
jgi:hydrogenase/urease accessory protein HupE